MKILSLVKGFVVALGISLGFPSLFAATHQVQISNFAFAPSSLTVKVGDTVTWRQNDFTQHTVTASDGSFNSPFLNSGQTFSHTFNSAGSFSYFCQPHPFMTGTITVEAAAAEPPVVTITSPANSASFTLPGAIPITATATVNGSTITGVEFFSDNTSLGTDNSSPYSIDANLAAGSHTLTARATAANGQTATSAPITITVNPEVAQAPVVTITNPTNNTALAAPGLVTISATATVNGSTITGVEFFDGSTSLGTDSTFRYSIDANLAAGTHTLTARATAANGQSATSTPVTVTVAQGQTAVPIENPYPDIVKSDVAVELQTIADGLVSPLGLAAPNDGRLFIYDQVGLIHVIANGAKLPDPLLDVRSRLVPLDAPYDERGLLGLALHPNFAQNGLLYTYTSEPISGTADFAITGTPNDHQSVIAEWKIDAASTNKVDVSSRREILRIDKPQSNHNAGTMRFGSDGMLYIAIGDGGQADDEGDGHSPQGNGQDLQKILGKMLRIDVNTRNASNGKYGIPTDNPFVDKDGLDEIYAYGFRNPYQWSFDRLTGEMYVADVGQNDIEEVDRVFKGGNYGWRIKEGTFNFQPNGTNEGFISATAAVTVPADLIDPIAEYDHSEGDAIVGGFVYRGTKITGLMGKYVAGDFGEFEGPEGRLFFLDRNQFRELVIGTNNRELGLWLKGFGEDKDGELYAMASSNLGPTGTGGKVFKIVPVTNVISITSIRLDGTNIVVSFTGGIGPFVLQGKPSISDPMWHTVGASAASPITVPLDGRAAFLQISDLSGNPALGFTVSLSGAAERPNKVTTPAFGFGNLSLEGNTLHFDITYSNLTGVAILAHIHGPASAADFASVLVNLAPYNGGAFGTSGTLSGSVTLTPQQKALVLAGKTYVNIHTPQNQGGEIRGQIAPVLFTSSLSGAAERLNPTVTAGTGSAILLLVGKQLTFEIDYAGLNSPGTLAHIHGPANSDIPAGVLVNLAPFNGGSFGTKGRISGSTTLTEDQLAALVDGLTYLNIHTTNYPGGEIRGQIYPASTAVALSATLTGAAERATPVTTPATGSANFALEGNTLYFNIGYSNLTGTAILAHIHGPASASEFTGVLVNLAPFNGGAFGTSGTLVGKTTLTDQQRAWLLQGRTYVNIHTPQNQGGEIRGQIAPVVMHAELLGASERASSVQATAKGRGTFMLVRDQLTVALTYSGLSGAATLAHIHGPAQTSTPAGVLVDMAPLNGGSFGAAGGFSGTVSLNAANLASLIDTLTYFNIHTDKNKSGEIRGQIIR